ncbi:MAG: DUF4349 domain-containing protein [Solirubrobacterales bacterium]
MDSSRDDEKLATALQELRPTPREEFAAELDERAAAGFPRHSRLGGLLERLRSTPPRKVLLPVGALAATVLVLGVVVAGVNSGGGDSAEQSNLPFLSGAAAEEEAESGGGEATTASQEATTESLESSAGDEAASGASAPSSSGSAAATGTSKRSIERSAEIEIGTAPAEVSDAASRVSAIVHANRGIVQRSSLDEDDGEARAEFELLIPSGKLGDALAEFSELGDVLSRNEATADITAPTVSTAERLQDSRARIDSLLGQLADATTEAERETVEAELRAERRHAARLRARLADLKRRANLSRVSLRIVSDGGTASGSSWGVGDAFHDAGRLLAGAAAVAIVVLAVLAPVALLALLAWLLHRAWLRRARARALS